MTEKDRLLQERLDLDWVTSTVQGRRFLWRLLSYCGIYHDIEGQSDAMLKQIGRRQVGLYLLGIVSDAFEDRVFDMMREAKNRDTEEKLKYDNSNSDTDNYDSNSYPERTIELDSLVFGDLPAYTNESGRDFPAI